MSNIPKPQEIYRHFKGKLYQVLTLAEDTETGETLVIYQALYGDFKVYARELGMFTSKVDREKYPNAPQEDRFELQSPEVLKNQQPAASVSVAEKTLSEAANREGAPIVTEPATPSAPIVNESFKPAETTPASSEEAEEELNLDPALIEFLDANNYEERLRILVGLHHRITQDMITTMAVACDVEVADGELEERFSQLKNCLLMLEKYECTRLR
ncbi:MAG: DUF1653 domain-containing protein [Lachnospiraceae bacterium]|nr:DUF1653 domain-containing protein [Lachnospiraceae bacterium]